MQPRAPCPKTGQHLERHQYQRQGREADVSVEGQGAQLGMVGDEAHARLHAQRDEAPRDDGDAEAEQPEKREPKGGKKWHGEILS